MARRPVELIEQALAEPDPVESTLLLAEAGIRGGNPEFAREALRGVAGDSRIAAAQARIAWLSDDYLAVIAYVDRIEGAGALDRETAVLGAKASWRAGDYARASRLARRAADQARAEKGLSERATRDLRWMSAYFDAIAGDPREGDWLVNRALVKRWQQSPEADMPIIGLFDYKGPDLSFASANLGDFIQTAAILRHIARFRGARLVCDQQRIHRSLRRLADSWSEEDRVAMPGDAYLAIFDRDAPQSVALRFPGRPVWAVYNGWFYHRQFGKNDAFPPPDNLCPIPLGFHLWRPSDLDQPLLDWLRRYAPIGCRDRNTMRWLLNQGIDAFLSGCPTMTLATAINPDEPRCGRCRVDIEKTGEGQGWETLTHHYPDLRTAAFAESIEKAVDRLDHYAGLEMVETGRLHCLLPCEALGTPVRFVPGKDADRRFEGLVGIADDDRFGLRDRITELLREMFTQILAGQTPDTVYERWRAMTAPLAVAAKAELFGKEPPPRLGCVEPVSVAPGTDGGMVTLVMAFDAAYAARAQAVLASIRANSQRPIRLVLLVRELEDRQLAPLSCAADAVETRIIPMDERLEGAEVELSQAITISTMDRLFLVDALPDLDRIVYIDCDTIVLGDIGELADHDPGPAGLAARPTPNPNVARIAEMLERRAAGMPADEARALRLRLAREIDLRQPGFNAGVLVMSLDTLRANGTIDCALDLVHRFGLHDQDALNFSSLQGYAALPARWNSIPQFDIDPDAALLHWVGARKPWMKTQVRCQKQWQIYARDLEPIPGLEPRASAKVTKDHWLDAGTYRADWDDRAGMAARWIAAGSHVLDLGCGARLSLKEKLPPGCIYQGLDQRSWSDEVIAMDLDTGDFPNGDYDVAAMLGLIEYLSGPAGVLALAAATARRLIVSYCHPCEGGDPGLREKRGWINAYDNREFLQLLEGAGWQVEAMETYRANANIRELLYRCGRR
ncbi:glycosyltransferase [Parasphingopyxis marina]|uniref:Lipopolysaccharide biosynthesis protein, LPS:glycosyltransferase n=1 Tax=Parasphingopyxis marina TaxID=2761622 RepID=A0A842HZI6_9SPHN|nr:glycosyltransferase [Parasphingopyxis marina]MBC2777789.1 hypothetical protein [Parasphingopyxis marina]